LRSRKSQRIRRRVYSWRKRRRAGPRGFTGLGFLRGKQEALFESADMEDFNDSDAGDTKEVGGVGGEEAGLDDTDDLEDEGGGGASDSDVETCIKKIVLIFKQAELRLESPGPFSICWMRRRQIR